ncbi:MAG: hypothetical protein KDK70_03695 [Myxococcales bacterium]|nr:hypothetical protein [Myxococcales bacterium]
MKHKPVDGTLFVPELVAQASPAEGHVELRAPAVGLWRDAPLPGQLVTPGSVVGELEILGVRHRVRAPAEAVGVVLEQPGPRLARRPVGYGDLLLRLDPEAGPASLGLATAESAAEAAVAGLSFRSPLSGRFYARPAPEQAPFVSVGDVVEVGQTVALLEVMKTFNRITYGGEGFL